MVLLPLPCRNRPPPLDHVNNFRHHCRYQRRAAPVVIHIDRNALFTSSEYAIVPAMTLLMSLVHLFASFAVTVFSGCFTEHRLDLMA